MRKMRESREKRITLRFYLDDPESIMLYERLQQRRQETGIPMSTLVLEAVRQYLDLKDHWEETFRAIFREELQSALRKRLFTTPQPEQVESATEDDGEDDSDMESLKEIAQSFSF